MEGATSPVSSNLLNIREAVVCAILCVVQIVCYLPERMSRDYSLPDNSPSEIYGIGSLPAGLCTPGHLFRRQFRANADIITTMCENCWAWHMPCRWHAHSTQPTTKHTHKTKWLLAIMLPRRPEAEASLL